jgi:hypothetical protein
MLEILPIVPLDLIMSLGAMILSSLSVKGKRKLMLEHLRDRRLIRLVHRDRFLYRRRKTEEIKMYN